MVASPPGRLGGHSMNTMTMVKKYIAAGWSADYVLLQLSRAAEKVALGKEPDGEASDMECELYVELTRFIPKYLIEYEREGRTWREDDSFATENEAIKFAAFYEREDRYGTLRAKVLKLHYGEVAEV